MDQTNLRSTPTKTKTALQHIYVLSHIYYERMELEEICLLAKNQPSSGHYKGHYIVQRLGLVN
jgi:hypothetical protein